MEENVDYGLKGNELIVVLPFLCLTKTFEVPGQLLLVMHECAHILFIIGELQHMESIKEEISVFWNCI